MTGFSTVSGTHSVLMDKREAAFMDSAGRSRAAGGRPRPQSRRCAPEARQCRSPHVAGTGTARTSGYGVTQPIEPTGKSFPVDVAVNPKMALPSGGMVRL